MTIWCHHDLYRAGYISWYKHISTSVPALVACKQFTLSGQMQKCYFSPKSERMVMSVDRKKTSLMIPAVHVSDTALYYCSFIDLDEIIFSNSSYVSVKVNTVTASQESLSTNSDRPECTPVLRMPEGLESFSSHICKIVDTKQDIMRLFLMVDYVFNTSFPRRHLLRCAPDPGCDLGGDECDPDSSLCPALHYSHRENTHRH